MVPGKQESGINDINFIILTGLSGAGKSQAAHALEDLGYFCVDNLPPALITKFAELCAQSAGKINKIALVIDIRGGDFFDDLFCGLKELCRMGFKYSIFFLEASDRALVSRYKETRRPHPLAPQERILEGIQSERERLEELRGQADIIINTTDLSPQELRQEMVEHLQILEDEEGKMVISVISFGFKYGLPLDADLIFDLRFLPNPHYVRDLREMTGLENRVRDYVFKWPVAQDFLERFLDFFEFLLPQYAAEGKSHLAIGLGCTGGRHRSVAIAHFLADHLSKFDYRVNEVHRDLQKE